jgi:hypothetical protein
MPKREAEQRCTADPECKGIMLCKDPSACYGGWAPPAGTGWFQACHGDVATECPRTNPISFLPLGLMAFPAAPSRVHARALASRCGIVLGMRP